MPYRRRAPAWLKTKPEEAQSCLAVQLAVQCSWLRSWLCGWLGSRLCSWLGSWTLSCWSSFFASPA